MHFINTMFTSEVLSENLWIWFFGSAAFLTLLGIAVLLTERRVLRRAKSQPEPQRPKPKEIDPSLYVLPEDSEASVQDMIEIKKMGGELMKKNRRAKVPFSVFLFSSLCMVSLLTGLAGAGADTSGPSPSEGRFLDHDRTVALGGVGNILDVSSKPPQKSSDQQAGTLDLGTSGIGVGETNEAMEDLDQRTLIHFDEGNASLEPHTDPKIQRIASELKKDANLQVVIEGHTDSKGSFSDNQKISEARANSVKSALISQGVSPSQIETYGFGATEPVASNTTVDGRAENRRVELYLEGHGSRDLRHDFSSYPKRQSFRRS